MVIDSPFQQSFLSTEYHTLFMSLRGLEVLMRAPETE